MPNPNARITIAVAVVCLAAWLGAWFKSVGGWQPPTLFFAAALCSTQAVLVGWVVTAVSTRRDYETRCRRCRYILRGLTEPRCPECGETI